jgi:hypothetical protein
MNSSKSKKRVKEKGERYQARIYEAYRAYAAGDLEAGKAIDEDVKAVMKKTGASYSATLAARLKELKPPTAEPRPRPTMAQRYSAGNELDHVTKSLMKWKNVSYTEGLRQAVLANPTLGEDYTGHEIRNDGFNLVYGVASAMQKVSNLITGTPRQDNGSLDIDAVLGVLELFGDLNREAAQEGLRALASKAVVNVPSQVDQMPTAMDEARRRYPALRRMAETGEATDEALRILFPQFFKD